MDIIRNAHNEGKTEAILTIDMKSLATFQKQLIDYAGICTFIEIIDESTGLIKVEWDNWSIDYIENHFPSACGSSHTCSHRPGFREIG